MTDVLHVLHTFPPETRGGVQRYVERVAAAQVEAGRTVAIACATGAASPGVDEWNGLDVHRLPALDPFEQLAGGGEGSERWTRLLDRLDAAVVHVHHWQGVPLDLFARARREHARRVATLHDFHATCPLFFRLRDERELCAPDVDVATCAACVAAAHGLEPSLLLEALPRRHAAFAAELGRAHVVLCASRAQADYWRRIPSVAGIEPTVLPLPFPDHRPTVHPPPTELPLRLVTWGGLVRGKGLHLLLDAVARFPAHQFEVHHHGPVLDEAYAAELRAHPAADRLALHGPFTFERLTEAVRHDHLAVHPSLFLETHGLTTDEALALGLPVVVPDRGAPMERIGGRGTTFRAGDADDLARVLGTILDDPETLARWRAGEPGPCPTMAEHLEGLARAYGWR